MMMLSTTALANVATAALSCIASPTFNKCVKRVAPSRFRYEPYGASVIPADRVEPCAAFAATAVSPTVAVPTAVKAMEMFSAAPTAQPKAPAVRYVVIRFKHESMTFLAPFRVAAGDLVVVEGDRGENIGTVETISKMKPSFDVERRIVRHATEADRESLAQQRSREAEAMRTTQSLAESLGLQASIEDTEYQFDQNKLTVYVRRASKNGFVDFRKLQRGLYRQFRCRIWCAYMDEIEAAEAGPRTK